MPGDKRYNPTKSRGSVFPKTSRSGFFRRNTLSWWRKAIISAYRSARGRKKISNRAPDQPENVGHRQKASPNIGTLASEIRFAVGKNGVAGN
ncbi:hypothetical protein [Aestuariivirga sp.]|uniref:hypothetical protein n=1 Tax=Aestuariivirga sp. TaxID=2650926 RepID=UPI003592EB57